MSIAWEYSDQELEVIPAYYSRITRPAWPATCELDSECDDGVWCNGKLSYHSTFLWLRSNYEIDIITLFSVKR